MHTCIPAGSLHQEDRQAPQLIDGQHDLTMMVGALLLPDGRHHGHAPSPGRLALVDPEAFHAVMAVCLGIAPRVVGGEGDTMDHTTEIHNPAGEAVQTETQTCARYT